MIELPALRGDDALGFLAAIGLTSLSEQDEIPALRLAWKTGAAPVAQVEGDVGSIEELSDALGGVLERLEERGAVLPGVDADFPLRVAGGTKDPMRMPVEDMAAVHTAIAALWRDEYDPEGWSARWLLALCGQVATDKDDRVALTSFYAPTGRMSLRVSLFEKTMEAVRRVEGPGDALTGWRRTGPKLKYDGANFDERAKRDAGVTTWGDPANQGAPSPTWLATMGIRFFPVTDDGSTIATAGWQRVRLYPGYTRRSLIWPIWEPLLDAPAIRTLLTHSALEVIDNRGDVKIVRSRGLEALGITSVFGSSRRTLSQGDGPLGPALRIWPRHDTALNRDRV
jgi:hypothetical protein